MTPEEIVYLIENIGNRPDIRLVQERQVLEIKRALLIERGKTIDEIVDRFKSGGHTANIIRLFKDEK